MHRGVGQAHDLTSITTYTTGEDDQPGEFDGTHVLFVKLGQGEGFALCWRVGGVHFLDEFDESSIIVEIGKENDCVRPVETRACPLVFEVIVTLEIRQRLGVVKLAQYIRSLFYSGLIVPSITADRFKRLFNSMEKAIDIPLANGNLHPKFILKSVGLPEESAK